MNILADVTSAILNADSYKVCHWDQNLPGTQYVSSYIEPRKSKYAQMLGKDFDFVEVFGMQAFLKEYLTKPITQEDIDIAEILFEGHGEPFNKKGWQHILDKHNGYLPIEVRAIPEGTVVPTGTAIAEIINTDPECYWLPSYVETALQRAVWYPTTVATKSRMIKEVCREFLDRTSDDPNRGWEQSLQFMLHDFGARGVSSNESSALAGMAHLVNFSGTDTVMAMVGTLGYYNTDFDKFLEETQDPKKALLKTLQKMKAEGTPMPAFSVEATEHSTMTPGGPEGEEAQIKRMIEKAKTTPNKIVSIVSDSFDYFHTVMDLYGDKFKQDILDAGKIGSRVVVRPDSGEPVEIICQTLEILCEKFKDEVKTIKKGDREFKLLPPCIRVLQGDGIDLDSLHKILSAMEAKGFSAENLVFGMGGGLEQKVNRDDLYFAQKTNATQVNDKWIDVQKKPKTEQTKVSKTGRLSTIWNGVAFLTKKTRDLVAGEKDQMIPVFRDGKILVNESFGAIRERAEYFMKLWWNKPTTKIEDPYAAAKAKPQQLGA